MKHRIFCFVNSGAGTDWQYVVALADDGHNLAGHISSSEGFAKHDIGYASEWKHEIYNEHFGQGNWELEWVNNPLDHEGIEAAMVLNKQLGEAAAKNQPSVEVTFSDDT